jgi:cell filamentation protein
VIPGTDVLRNKLGIRDPKELERAERLLTADRLAELAGKPVAGNFDLAHLQSIHRAIFQDVYDWAGKLREINISKGGIRFALTGKLESSAHEIFARLARDNHLREQPPDGFARFAAEFLADVNALHPFREGNGRAQREFFRELAARAGLRLDWTRTNSKEMVEASIAGMIGDAELFERILLRAARCRRE